MRMIKLAQQTKKFYDLEIPDIECPHCKKILFVGLDYSVVIDSPEDIYIEIQDSGVIQND